MRKEGRILEPPAPKRKKKYKLTITSIIVRDYSDGSGVTAATSATGSGGNTGTNWIGLCNKISFALVSSCNTLVDPDNTLTDAGTHARDCIQGGALLAAGALLIGVDAGTIASTLPKIAEIAGCGDVVDFNNLTIGQLQGLGSIFK